MSTERLVDLATALERNRVATLALDVSRVHLQLGDVGGALALQSFAKRLISGDSTAAPTPMTAPVHEVEPSLALRGRGAEGDLCATCRDDVELCVCRVIT